MGRQVWKTITPLGNILDKFCHLESRMEDLFGSLKSELSCLRNELNDEIEKVKSTVNDVETSLNAPWDTIKDLQDEPKIGTQCVRVSRQNSFSARICYLR